MKIDLKRAITLRISETGALTLVLTLKNYAYNTILGGILV